MSDDVLREINDLCREIAGRDLPYMRLFMITERLARIAREQHTDNARLREEIEQLQMRLTGATWGPTGDAALRGGKE